MSQYLDSNGSLPTGQSDARGRRLQSWQKDILPYLGVITGGEIQKDLPRDHPRNSADVHTNVEPGCAPVFVSTTFLTSRQIPSLRS